jgi:hypothetical protein
VVRIFASQERPVVIRPNQREMAACRIERQAEDVGEEPGSGYFVTRGHDSVVQDDGHAPLYRGAKLHHSNDVSHEIGVFCAEGY